jgi:septal ring factor EnvC (AmiA/AmiB activator)
MNSVKLVFILFLSSAFLLTSVDVNAQTISKKRKKELKKELKELKKDPAKYDKMLKKNAAEKKEMEDENTRLKTAVSDLEEQNNLLKLQIDELDARYSALLEKQSNTSLPDGIAYQVQMGYYQYLNLASFNEQMKTIKAEEVDGAKRYVVGHFLELEDAIQFRDDIKKLGIEDAFVSQYINGERNMKFDAEKAR